MGIESNLSNCLPLKLFEDLNFYFVNLVFHNLPFVEEGFFFLLSCSDILSVIITAQRMRNDSSITVD